MAPGRGNAVAELLDDLKRRSGYSYEQIAARTHLSRSTVHRYCSGQGIPQTFGAVESIATVCGASRAELSKLHRLWEGPDRDSGPDGTAMQGDAVIPEMAERPEGPGDSGVVERPVPRPQDGPAARARWWWFPAAVATFLATFLLVAYVLRAGPPPTSAPAEVSAPDWTLQPQPIDPAFVGVTMNSATGMMPGFPVGSARLWESETRWQSLEPERGRYDWTTFDRLVRAAGNAGLPLVFTFGGTPGWAAPEGGTSAYNDDSRIGPPDDLDDWERFVRAVATRSAGRVEAFELWDFGPPYFTGSVETLVEMTEIGSRVIREVAPGATVVCPGFGELWEPANHAFLARFAELRGYDHCDAGGVKLHPRKAADPPETMFELGADIERTLHNAHANPSMWNTGVSFADPFDPKVEPERAADHAVRLYLVSLWLWYDRVYFYSWGGGRVPIPLQAAGFPPTKAGRFVGEFQNWLRGARINSCGHGGGALLPENVWQCRFDRGGERFVIRWTHEGTAWLPPEPGSEVVQRLDGSSEIVDQDQPMEITGRPVLLRPS
ncbi:helix-turn-helix transcriptional regulator [Saccharopolyspora gloriosae]|uniref:helix-turn-helix domain-containing protein n=1 Tax=Saccharopolyspora gloriosae TaxID=455344 RepID=UPI001FB75B15|nr:helix-turn-helix transcriptional regulator [Saccharopolyspora gloriosae]